jgi:hypothetical protein
LDQQTNTGSDASIREFRIGVVGFTVVDRGGVQIGAVRDVSLDRGYILVATSRQRIGRKRTNAVHVAAARQIDTERRTITLAVTQADVVGAPDLKQQSTYSLSCVSLRSPLPSAFTMYTSLSRR